MREWKLQLPVASGSGGRKEVTQPQLANYELANYFFVQGAGGAAPERGVCLLHIASTCMCPHPTPPRPRPRLATPAQATAWCSAAPPAATRAGTARRPAPSSGRWTARARRRVRALRPHAPLHRCGHLLCAPPARSLHYRPRRRRLVPARQHAARPGAGRRRHAAAWRQARDCHRPGAPAVASSRSSCPCAACSMGRCAAVEAPQVSAARARHPTSQHEPVGRRALFCPPAHADPRARQGLSLHPTHDPRALPRPG